MIAVKQYVASLFSQQKDDDVTAIYCRNFPPIRLQDFSKDELAHFPLFYLRYLDCQQLSNVYSKLQPKFQNDKVIKAKSFRCSKRSHWPSEGDVPDCPPPFKIDCVGCILSKISSKDQKLRKIIKDHLCMLKDFCSFNDEEIKLFPLFYLMYNVDGECLMQKWSAIPEEYKENIILQAKLPCKEHSKELNRRSRIVYKYQCYKCFLENKFE